MGGCFLCVWGWACNCCWSQRQEEGRKSRICQHLFIRISLHLKQHDFRRTSATISLLPYKLHANFSLNSELFLASYCRTKLPQETKCERFPGFVQCQRYSQVWDPGLLPLSQLSTKCSNPYTKFIVNHFFSSSLTKHFYHIWVYFIFEEMKYWEPKITVLIPAICRLYIQITIAVLHGN